MGAAHLHGAPGGVPEVQEPVLGSPKERLTMRVIDFPGARVDDDDNEPITPERIAIVNAINDGLRAHIAAAPGATRADIEWALRVAADCIVSSDET